MVSLKMVRRIVIAVVGGTVLLVGIVLIVLPGPAIVVIPAGLAILALEFAWAKRWLRKTKELIAKYTPGKARREREAAAPDPTISH